MSKTDRQSVTGIRVLVCGGRNYADWRRVSDVMRSIHDATPIDIIIHGCAGGADTLAGLWALSANVRMRGFHADWETHGRAAGPIRNQKMLTVGTPHLVVAFPGGRGTADMVQKARRANIEVREIQP